MPCSLIHVSSTMTDSFVYGSGRRRLLGLAGGDRGGREDGALGHDEVNGVRCGVLWGHSKMLRVSYKTNDGRGGRAYLGGEGVCGARLVFGMVSVALLLLLIVLEIRRGEKYAGHGPYW